MQTRYNNVLIAALAGVIIMAAAALAVTPVMATASGNPQPAALSGTVLFEPFDLLD